MGMVGETQEHVDADAIREQQLGNRVETEKRERAVVLRVYSYYRIVLSFVLLIVFYGMPDQTFVGSLAPLWFQLIAGVYLTTNVAYGFMVLLKERPWMTHPSSVASFVIFDLFFLAALLLTSGGVQSGLGYLLVFSVAFGGIMLRGQMSMLFAAIAAVSGISVEYYLHNTDVVSGSQHFFEMALLGLAFFLVDYLFQYIANLIGERDQELVSLAALDKIHRIAEESRHELEVSNARFTVLLESTGEGVLGIDMAGCITFANPSAYQLLDIDHVDLIGSDIQRFMIIATTEDSQDNDRPQKILELLDLPAMAAYDPERWQTAKGDHFIIDYSCEATISKRGERTGAVLLFRNVTQQRENEERVAYLANFDDLTGLANRTNFTGVLRSALARNLRGSRHIAVLIADTDHLTVINEKLGQQAGDVMLKTTAERLKSVVRPGDMIARLHGDQFAIMLVDLDHAESVALVADKIVKEAVEPITMADGTPITNSLSIGIAVSDDEKDADEMISAATSAVGDAKAQGRNTYRFFHPDMQKRVEEKKRVQMMLRSAIDNDEFKLLYQPIVNLKERRIQSAEALIHWTPPNADPIRPDLFIPIAEESGQINSIGSWVLKTVIEQVKSWREHLGSCPSVAINVSSKQLKNQEFREQFQSMLHAHSLSVDGIELELTETGVMDDPERSLAELLKLHDLGVSISIDDFGTGYSSLDYLRRLPLDILKIDQSFTFGIGESEHDEEIVRMMIRMAHAMGLKVICEGVETGAHLEFLQEHDCDYVQGYYFSKPRSVQDMTELLKGKADGSINIMDLAGTT